MSRRAWLENKYTKTLLNKLSDERELLLDRWEEGTFTHETAEGTAQKNAQALGRVGALKDFIIYITELKLDGDEDE